jgi:Fe-S-cluster containining protein
MRAASNQASTSPSSPASFSRSPRRGPLYLRLAPSETKAFRAHTAALGVELDVIEAPDGSGTVSFLEHTGERCPMLDAASSACRIYEERPRRCREFPDGPRPDCPISGASE